MQPIALAEYDKDQFVNINAICLLDVSNYRFKINDDRKWIHIGQKYRQDFLDKIVTLKV